MLEIIDECTRIAKINDNTTVIIIENSETNEVRLYEGIVVYKKENKLHNLGIIADKKNNRIANSFEDALRCIKENNLLEDKDYG